jgi:Fe-S-cluster containining protein
LPVRDSKRLPTIPVIGELFSRLEAETSAFAGASGLRCPDGCGACCESPNVYTSVVELEPLAQELVARGEAEAALDRAAQAAGAGPGPCVFYASHGPGLGRCTVYALRPMICRLFGFAAVRNKQGQPELAGCRVHKAAQPEVMEHARAMVAGGQPVPMMTDWQQQAAELGTSATGALVPINQAIQQALERALFAAALAGAGAQSSGEGEPPEPGPGREPGA